MKPAATSAPTRAALVLALAASLALSCAKDRRPSPTGGPLGGCLPAEGTAGWVRDGDPELFEGEALYTYINGGAEIYHEYGFRRVLLQDYEDKGGRSVSVEIFEMEAPSSAYGMFTFKRSGKGRPAGLGDGSELASYYLNFWKGRFLVTLTGFDEHPATIEGLLALAAAVDARIPEKGQAPGLVAALPPEGLEPGSVRYIRGRLGLNSLVSLPAAGGPGFEEGVGGSYGNGTMLVILGHGSADEARASLAGLTGTLSASEAYRAAVSGGVGPACFLDEQGRCVCLAGEARRLFIAAAPDASACRELIARSR